MAKKSAYSYSVFFTRYGCSWWIDSLICYAIKNWEKMISIFFQSERKLLVHVLISNHLVDSLELWSELSRLKTLWAFRKQGGEIKCIFNLNRLLIWRVIQHRRCYLRNILRIVPPRMSICWKRCSSITADRHKTSEGIGWVLDLV